MCGARTDWEKRKDMAEEKESFLSFSIWLVRCGLTQNNPDILALSLSSLLQTTIENEETKKKLKKPKNRSNYHTITNRQLFRSVRRIVLKNGKCLLLIYGVWAVGSP